ncbi:peptidase U62 modulator of DNA gyrase [Thermococcus litoralis DSM 5473]|uniref:Peptidase U62 modulator of DNA gyrase n=1 Tax=Thermococcus litoralis (strain ATCC 51850 / DSM 5473 / JCM 8560 / NS-C) TaxID=523849 RepID=H3ZN48_THELN|nr:TldD/PmbA family protein [Thermococcus litoralis]EHR78600.1 peptidase U62 modulator of DNA gyrase [Thermococcus litoralis DSM 5473]
MHELVEFAVEKAQELGASYAEARFEEKSGTEIVMKNGNPEGLGILADRGIGIRVLVNGGMGFASTNVLTKESVEEAVKKAVKLAKAAAKLRNKPIQFSEEDFHQVFYEVKMKKDFRDVSAEEKMEYLKLIEERVKETGVNVPMRFLRYGDFMWHKVFMNNEGALVESLIPRVSVTYNLVVFEEGQMEQAPFVQRAFSGGLELIEKDKPWEWAVKDVKALQRLIKEGQKPPEGKVDVVISPEVAGIAVHESVGHPYELDRIMGREAAQAGESFVKPEMLGERIGSEAVTVIEDPTIPNSWGFYLYDDEGVKARPRYLIREGIINELLMNREYAAYLGMKSNAAARAINYNREPIVRMANTYLAPGDYSFEELIEDVKLGVYMVSFNEWNIDDRRYQQRYIGREAYLIENGEIKHPVRRPILEITTKGLWSSVDAVGKEVEFYPGTCGKGEPGQGVPVWMGGAHARLRDVVLRR